MATDSVIVLGCGDVGPNHEPVAAYSELIRPMLATGDIRFAQCERLYSERGTRQQHGSAHSRVKPHTASVFSDCGVDVVSLASNHAMDWGPDALADTIELLEHKGVRSVGAGRSLRSARRPAILERNGVRIAFLGYCSVVREGYAATADQLGVAPLRVHSSYEPRDPDPGVPPRVVTIPDAADLEALVEDVTAAKREAHAVVLSLHWGVHFIPRMIAGYQPIVAQAAIDAGADLILGHHPHIPKAIEVRQGKVCFYSLGNFIMTFQRTPESEANFLKNYGECGVTRDPHHPELAYGQDSKRSLIAKALITREGVKRVSFLPVLIDRQMRPEVLRASDERFHEMVSYMDWASEGYNHEFTVTGDEVLVTG